MHTFTLGTGRGWFAGLLGRNPLVRTTDRLDALTLLLAVVLVALAAAKAGQHLTIWVDDRGEYAGPPPPRGRAAAEGASAGVVLWLTAAALGATLFTLVRCRLDRRRHAAWDRSLRGLVGDDGGRRNSDR